MRLVATVKPWDDVVDRVSRMIELEILSFRVNFARGSQDANAALVDFLQAHDEVSTVFADIPGRKPRLQALPDRARKVEPGERYLLVDAALAIEIEGALAVSDGSELARAEVGDRVVVGSAICEVTAQRGPNAGILVQVTATGEIYSRCGVAVPARYRTNRDLGPVDVDAVAAGAGRADMLCVSFADTPEVIAAARAVAENVGATAAIVAKVETPNGLARCERLLDGADGVMLGRGDLGSFLTAEEMDGAAAEVVRAARRHGKLAIVASDYFVSMAKGDRSLSDADRRRLEATHALAPDYVVLNETASSDNWRRIVDVASEIAAAWGGPASKT